MIRTRRWLLLALLVLVAGCGNAHSGPAAGATPTPYAQPISVPYPITAVLRTGDPRVVRVLLAGVPLESVTGVCHTEVDNDLNEGALSIGIGVTVLSRVLPPFPGCATGSRTLLVRLAQPLGRRDVFASGRVTPEGGRFIAVGNGYQECRPPGCDPTYQPVVPDCANLREAIAGTDVPAHFGMAGPCRGSYAAIVVDIGAGACPVTGDKNPCSGRRLTRQLWHSDGTRWRLVVQGKDATCVTARQALASYPTALCSDPEWLAATR